MSKSETPQSTIFQALRDDGYTVAQIARNFLTTEEEVRRILDKRSNIQGGVKPEEVQIRHEGRRLLLFQPDGNLLSRKQPNSEPFGLNAIVRVSIPVSKVDERMLLDMMAAIEKVVGAPNVLITGDHERATYNKNA